MSSTAEQRTFAGYGAWVGRFLDAVGIDRVALVAGHSFGGGVATAFVHHRPERVSSLLLANAIGGPTWALFPNEVRTMMQRPVLGLEPALRRRHPRLAPRCSASCPRLLEDFVPNLVRNPLGMLRTGEFIRRADLVQRSGPSPRGGSRSRWPGPTATDWCRGRPSTSCATPPGWRVW